MIEAGASRFRSNMAKSWLLAIAIICCSLSATLGADLEEELFSSSQDQQLPPFDPPAGTEIWRLGVNREGWDTLKNILAKFKNFYVTDPQSNKHLDEIRHRVDESQDGDHWPIISTLLLHGSTARPSEILSMVLDLLSLGINPDKPDRYGHRAIIQAIRHRDWMPVIKALALCRVNMTAGDKEGSQIRSPMRIIEQLMQDAMNRNDKIGKEVIQQVHDILKKAETDPTPLAQLASEKEWWAVKHLCRRAVLVDEAEAVAKYNGRTALEWAAFHGETGMVAELSYYFSSVEPHEPTSTTTSSTTTPVSTERKETAGSSDQMDTISKAFEEMNQAILDLRSELQGATFVSGKCCSLLDDKLQTLIYLAKNPKQDH